VLDTEDIIVYLSKNSYSFCALWQDTQPNMREKAQSMRGKSIRAVLVGRVFRSPSLEAKILMVDPKKRRSYRGEEDEEESSGQRNKIWRSHQR
jgi:hypothetical protein